MVQAAPPSSALRARSPIEGEGRSSRSGKSVRDGPGKIERPRPRGWAGPSGRLPKLATIESGPGGGGGRELLRRISPTPRRGTNADREERPCENEGTGAEPRRRRLGRGQKKGSIRRWSLTKVRQTDEGGGYAVCHVDENEGGGFIRHPCRRSAGPREEGSVRRLSDNANMCVFPHSSNALKRMPAMHYTRGLVSILDP
jgi:hypothetical protein